MVTVEVRTVPVLVVSVAVTVAVCETGTVPTVTVKVEKVVPAATVMLDGTGNSGLWRKYQPLSNR